VDKAKLSKLIKKLVQEYTGTGDSGGNAGDGNNVVSPRTGGIFPDDEQELLDYMYKSIYGGDGGHYKNYVKTQNYNSLNHQGMFELNYYNFGFLHNFYNDHHHHHKYSYTYNLIIPAHHQGIFPLYVGIQHYYHHPHFPHYLLCLYILVQVF
jgi:hypothetical protein